MTIHPTKQKVFLLEMAQWIDYDNKHAKALQHDLSLFLGGTLLPRHKYKPEKHVRYDAEINICDKQHLPVREVLMSHSKKVSKWILKYLMKNPQIVVLSRSYFIELIKKYEKDPCDDK